jgi:type II secretion system protein N
VAGSTSWGRRVAKGLGYGLFAVGIYALALWWLFPYPELARKIEAELRLAGVAAQVEGLGPGPFPGLKARRIRVSPEDQPWGTFDLDDTRMRLSPAAALSGKWVVELVAKVMGGRVETSYTLGDRPTIQATYQGIDLGQLPLPPAVGELPISGSVSGRLDAELSPEEPERITGQLDTTLGAIKLGAGKVSGLPVPEVSLGEGTIQMSAKNGKVEIATAAFEGGDLGIDFKGSVLLRERFSRSLVNGVLSLRPNDRIAKELAVLFAVFPGQKASDGRYTARVRGNLDAPRLVKR